MRLVLLLLLMPALGGAGELAVTERLIPPSSFQLRSQRVRRAFHLMHGRDANTLEVLRERDQSWRFAPHSGQVYGGAGIFGGVVILIAHAPGPLRPLFDRNWHVGPALLDGGGMGAAFGGRW